MKKLSITDVCHDGATITGIEADKQWLCLRETNLFLARQNAIPILPLHITEALRRVLIYETGKPPMMATVHRNRAGIFLKTDGIGGNTHEESRLIGILFPLEALQILISRWTVLMNKEVASFSRKKK